MEIKRVTQANCDEAAGLVVVIDVLRAFTTSAFAFGNGADKILLVSKVEEAFALRAQHPNSLIMGEVKGIPPDGFDFGNSPSLIMEADVNGRLLIQRTSAGTQGVVCSAHTETMLTSSFVVAQATADFIQQHQPQVVTLLITDSRPGYGDEDVALADYLEALLRQEPVDAAPYLARVRDSATGRKFSNRGVASHYNRDVEFAVQLDRFSFAMQVKWQDNLLVMVSA